MVSVMESTNAGSGLASVFAPLIARFGDGLGLARDGRCVRWSYEGQAAVVELRDDTVEARFFERPGVDGATKKACAAVYRTRGSGYALTPAGCAALGHDLVDFFSGVREPRFVFSDALLLEG
jgi:hypothetical protein